MPFRVPAFIFIHTIIIFIRKEKNRFVVAVPAPAQIKNILKRTGLAHAPIKKYV